LIKGKILDEETNDGLPGVVIRINSSQEALSLMFGGEFSFQSTVSLPLQLSISMSSYDTVYIDVTDHKIINLSMRRAKEFDEVIVGAIM
jgi:hypothetical protein